MRACVRACVDGGSKAAVPVRCGTAHCARRERFADLWSSISPRWRAAVAASMSETISTPITVRAMRVPHTCATLRET